MTATLNEIMEIDLVVRVHPNGRVTEESGIYAPYLYGEELERSHDGNFPWQLMTGYSGQYGYRGAVLHPSEFIGGGLERAIRATPGLYVAIVSYSEEADDETGEFEPVGWAVAYIPDGDNPADIPA